ncbi:L,D-transpeptidase [Jatrophihabitans endophyticus]|uniref:L,D-transpeptidase family protein n=1 Tax=Jatrophihabitans endophyticus TaxID=1206085 RepID=UPI0019EC32A5|nr:L,D-transpeptidase family protein [Jatrophihabitans endophyticus]MBE7187966.1 hypothetical protein [Jatrophihabitans endophyticus]
MTFGRAVASVTASLAVAGCAVVAVGMSRTHHPSPRTADAAHLAAPTARPAFLPPTGTTAAAAPRQHRSRPATPPTTSASPRTSASPTTSAVTTSAAPTTHVAASTSAAPTTHTAPTTHAAPTTAATRASTHAPTHPRTTHARTAHSAPATHKVTHKDTHSAPAQRTATAPKGHKLPLGFTTGNARKVITVVAHSHHSTTATLQAWSKAAGGWVKHGSAIHAHVGTDGLTRHASESRSATPIGSFTLTRAFGRDHNPGTSLPYVHTTPADWWISQPGKLYNTLQECSSHCAFTQGSPNEHLYYETPYYDYAVVIDYNTRNAPGGVHQGKGSAFFLHVHPAGTGGTAGCVDIPVAKLVKIMRWLTPSSHARILIGVS